MAEGIAGVLIESEHLAYQMEQYGHYDRGKLTSYVLRPCA